MFSRFRQRIASFMYGRYGADTLYWWSVGAVFALYFIQWIFRAFRLNAASNIAGFIGTVLFVIALLRFFSKNIYRRSAENRRFSAMLSDVKKKYVLAGNKIRDRRTHVYKACPHCKATLRLPRNKGDHTVRCPKCGERFSVRVR